MGNFNTITSKLLLCAFTLALAFTLSPTPYAKADNPLPVVGWISMKPDRKNPKKIRISARAFSKRAIQGRYFFTLVRQGPGGKAHSNQSGVFSTDGKRTALLSRTTINLPNSGVFKVRLQLIMQGEVVFTTTLSNHGHY